MVIYVFSIAFTDASSQYLYGGQGGTDVADVEIRLYFGGLMASGDTPFQAVLGGVSWGQPLSALSHMDGTGSFFVMAFYLYIVFTLFAILNVVAALFCQTAIETLMNDHDSILES